jgi:hypothetical protein
MTFQQFVSKMANDQKFRVAVSEDPEKALTAAGMKPSAQIVSALKGVNYAQLDKVAAAFGHGAAPDTMS